MDKKEKVNNKGEWSPGVLTSREECKKAIEKFDLFSDVLVREVLKDIPACQHILRILTGQSDLVVRSVDTEYRISQITSHDAVLDALAEDAEGRLFDIEVQGRDTTDHVRRTRFYGSMLDSEFLLKGREYDQLPDIYVIYICRADFLQTGQTISEIRKYQGDTHQSYVDGRHILFVNAEVDDDSPTAELMRYFLTADPDDMSQGALSERVRLLKREKEGEDHMCEVMDELIEKFVKVEREKAEEERRRAEEERRRAEEERRKIARNLFFGGISLEMIATAFGETAAVVKGWLELSRPV